MSAQLDLTTLEPRKDSFIDPELEQQFVDLLYAVRLKTGEPVFVYTLFEHKSYAEPHMALDMLRYMVRIWDQERRNGSMVLTPVIPIVLYHGRRPWRAAVDFGELFVGPDALRTYRPAFTYELTDLAHSDEEETRGFLYLQVAMLLLRTIFRPDFLDYLPRIVGLMTRLTKHTSNVEYVVAVLSYVAAVRKDATPEAWRQAVDVATVDNRENLMATWVDQMIEERTQLRLEQRYQRGMEQGRVDEAAMLIGNLLKHRFGTIELDLELRLKTLTLEQLETLSTAVLDARSLRRWSPE